MLKRLIKVAAHINVTARALLCLQPEFLKGIPFLEFTFSIFVGIID